MIDRIQPKVTFSQSDQTMSLSQQASPLIQPYKETEMDDVT